MADMPKNEYTIQHAEEKKKFHLPLSAWLSYLVAATLLFGSVSLAKYTTSTTDGDKARVANFKVAATADLTPDGNGGNDDKIVLSTTTLNDRSCTLKVENTSEVVVNCTIIIENIPYRIAVSKDGGEYISSGKNGESWNAIYDAGVLKINETKEYTFTFKVANEYASNGNYKMNIKVRFDQVD